MPFYRLGHYIMPPLPCQGKVRSTTILTVKMRDSKKVLTAIASVLFVICIPTLLITTDLRFAINSASLYEYEFNKHHVSEVTGLDKEELLGVALAV